MGKRLWFLLGGLGIIAACATGGITINPPDEDGGTDAAANCDGSVCNGACVNPKTDSKNCGACGKACADNEACVAGSCKCNVPLAKCGTTCVDLQTTADNCGKCGTVCVQDAGGGHYECKTGKCSLVCDPPTTDCTGECKDLQNDDSFCGDCNTTCATDEKCMSGLCCKTTESVCSGKCVDTQTDATNCGKCGTVCGSSTPYCDKGTCVSGCLGGKVPPSGCATGTDAHNSSKYVVCKADCTNAWISADYSGTYHADEICKSYGYSKMSGWDGTYGAVCGYGTSEKGVTSCSKLGTKKTTQTTVNCGSDSYGGMICATVSWECTK